MKQNLSPMLLATALLLTACKADDALQQSKDASEKTPIEFSMTDNTNAVVAVDGNTRAGFSGNTGIVMQMVASDNASTPNTKTTKTVASAVAATQGKAYSNVTYGANDVRYWDDAYGRDTKLSIYAVAVPDKELADDSKLYGLGGSTSSKTTTWGASSSSNTLEWTLTNDKTTTENIAGEDLVYSNNIQETFTTYNKVNGVVKYNFDTSSYPEYSSTVAVAGQMKFSQKSGEAADGPGRFDRGNLNFVHALSRVTINVKYGVGFSGSETVTDAKLYDQPYKGTFDVKAGTFSSETKGNVAMAAGTATGDVKGYFQGQVLPGYEISKSASTTNFLSFNVGDNVYYVTNEKVYTALTEGDKNNNKLDYKTVSGNTDNSTIVMTQGKNYVLNITVSKTKVENITATLADWTTITADEYKRNNAYLKFTFSDYAQNNKSTNFTLFRSAYTYGTPVTDENYTADYTWDKGYINNSAVPTKVGETNTWQVASWYWDDNKTFYHFRMVGNDGADTPNTPTIQAESDGSKEYFEIKAGNTDGNYRWGAPMAKSGTTDQTLTYNTTNGFDAVAAGNTATHHISCAIGATNDNIHFTEVNTLAKIVVNLTTTETSDKVSFLKDSKKATVSLVNIYTNGKVYMGNGLVVPTGSRSTDAIAMTAPTGENAITTSAASGYNYCVVPQELVEGTSSKTYVTFKIELPDGNVYYIKEDLSTITASKAENGTSVSIGQTANQAIEYWYPNCTYTYTFRLKKTGIEKITATLVPYTVISGKETDITLED